METRAGADSDFQRLPFAAFHAEDEAPLISGEPG